MMLFKMRLKHGLWFLLKLLQTVGKKQVSFHQMMKLKNFLMMLVLYFLIGINIIHYFLKYFKIFLLTKFFFSFDMEIDELEALISQLPKSDLNAHEYIHIEDEIPEGGLTDDEIVDAIQNADKEEESIIDDTEFTPILEKVNTR